MWRLPRKKRRRRRQEQRDAASKARGGAGQMAAAAAAIMAKGKADDKLSSAELLSLIKWKLGKAGGSSKFGRKGARFTAWVGQFKDAPVPDDDYDVVDLPYEAELVELEALLARPAAAPASAPAAAAAPDAAPATTPAAPVVAAVDAEHATEEALEAHMAVLQAQLVRVRRQKQHAAAEDLARAPAGDLAAAAPAVAKRQRRR